MDNAVRAQLLEMTHNCLRDMDAALGVWDLVPPEKARIFSTELALWVNDWVERSQDLKDLDKLHLLDVLSAKTRILAAQTREAPSAQVKSDSWASAKTLLLAIRTLLTDYLALNEAAQSHLESLLLKAK